MTASRLSFLLSFAAATALAFSAEAQETETGSPSDQPQEPTEDAAATVPDDGTIAIDDDVDDLADMSLEELLDTSVTTASRADEKLSDAPGVITVVTQDELRRFRGRTLRDILNRVPSLIASTTNFSDRTTIAPRGDQIRIDSGHVLVLINGRPTRESLEGGVSSEVFEAFPVNIIERIEIIRGPGSVLYGSNAFSAVINVITQEPEDTSTATIEALGGVPASYGEAVKSRSRIGDLSVVAAASYLKRADWKTTYRHSPPDSVDVTTREVSIPNVREGAYLGLDYKGVSLMSSFNQWDHSYFWRGTVGQNRWRRAFGDLGYRFRVVEELEWDMALHATYTLADMRASTTPGVQRRSHDVIGEWTNFLHLHKSLRLVAGALFNHVAGQEDYVDQSGGQRLTVSDQSRSNAGFYAQLDYHPIDALGLIGGVQLNAIENIDPSVVPRAGIVWNPLDKITAKALYGQAFRAPSLNEIALRHPELWGQSDLRPEKVDAIDVGASYLGKQVSVGVNYFHAKQRDIIMVDLVPSSVIDAPDQYANLGEVLLQGIEFESKYYIIDEVLLTGSTLYFVSEDGEGDSDVTPIPRVGTKAGLSYMSDHNGITASLFHIFQGPLDRSYTARLNPDPDPYHLLNFYGSLDIVRAFDFHFARGLALFVEAQNLLGEEIFLPDWGGVIAETIPVYPGRTVYIGVTASVPHEQN
jgi:outer membrane receptor for ferrienterochelin and colicin